MAKLSVPSPPPGASAAGRDLWAAVHAEYVLDDHEVVLLREAVRTIALIDALEVEVSRDGPLVSSSQGLKAHPGVVEGRQQRIALARILAAIRLPFGDVGEGRPQRRSGVRRPYKLHGVS